MRLGGLFLWLLLAPLAALALVLLPLAILCSPKRFKEAMRAVDELGNAFWFNGLGRESMSSHSWRERGNHWWANFIICFTNAVQFNHCYEANQHEQPVVDFINRGA